MEMSTTEVNDYSPPPLSRRHSTHSFDGHLSPEEIKPLPKPRQPKSQIPQVKNSKKLSTSMIIIDQNPPVLKPARTVPVLPSIGRHSVQGVLVRFFPNGEAYHSGVKIAINEFELKSWEAFLNYLNRQPRLALATGGIKHIYSLHGQEIRSINRFQNRQCYIVASGTYIRTSYRHIQNAFNDDVEVNGNIQPSSVKRWRSSSSNGEQIFLIPYSRLNMYESILLNRNSSITYTEWLYEEVTDLLSRYINNDVITHLYAIKKFEFSEVKSFSHLFNILKITDTFIACTDEEFEHSKRYLATIRPDDLFKSINGFLRYNPKSVMPPDAKLSIDWVYGYDGRKNIYALSEDEILYVMNTVCVLYEPHWKQQRFYTKHNNPITCVSVHRCHSIVASNEINFLKDHSQSSIHIWDHIKLEKIGELRNEQFGSDVSLLSFSPKPDDHFLLVVSYGKPKTLLIVDWKLQEIIYSINTKADRILSVLFAFDTIEWMCCVSQQRLLFYNINWNAKPLRVAIQRESEVQNIYTGAMACDHSGERLIVGDTVGNAHVWSLINNEPRLMGVNENILENEVQIILSPAPDLFILANGQNEIKLWNVKFDTYEHVRIKNTFGSIQSICVLRDKKCIIGTKMNYLLSKEIDTEEIEVITRGHTSPTICICYDKNNEYFYSISSDRYLFKWDTKTRSIEWSIRSPQLISCADLHPERNIIILGTETSKVLVYDTLSSYYITTISLKGNSGVKSVRFSPEGGELAMGLQNGTIWVFDVLGNGDFQLHTHGTSQYHNASVTDVIWSVDGSYLLSIYSGNNYNIWSMPSLGIVKGKPIQSIPWHQGIHPITCNTIEKNLSIVDTNTSAILLPSNQVLCCGKDGQLRLFRNSYELRSTVQTFSFGFGSIKSLTPSPSNNSFLLSLGQNPAMVEIHIDIESE